MRNEHSLIRLFGLTLGLSLVAATAAAMDVKGSVTALNPTEQTISVKVDDKDQAFGIGKDVKVFVLSGRGIRAGFTPAPGGIRAVKVGELVTMSTDFVDGKEVAVMIKIETPSGGVPLAGKPVAPAKRPKPVAAKPADNNDIKGTVTALVPRKLQMTLQVEGKQQTYTVEKDCKVFVVVKGAKKKPRYDVAPNGLADITIGLNVTITVDSQSGKELVTMVKINTPTK